MTNNNVQDHCLTYETNSSQRVGAKKEKRESQEREKLEKNKVKELLRATKAESKEEVKKKKERVKAHLDEVARNYNEKKQGEKERENLLKKAHGKENRIESNVFI